MGKIYRSKFVKDIQRRKRINSAIGITIWTAVYFLLYFYLRGAAYHVRFPNKYLFAAFSFLDTYLLLWWFLGTVIVSLAVNTVIYRRMAGSFDLTLDFMKNIWEKPEERQKISPGLDEVMDLLNYFQDQLHNLTQTIKQEQQRKNDLVVYLAHDLKTPLTSVQGYLEIVMEQPELSEKMKQKYVGIAAEKAERLEELIDEFFDISRFNLTDICIHCSKVNVTRLLEQELFEFQPMLRSKNLSCEMKTGENFVWVCDSDKMQRVIDNLLRNAVNYSYPDSIIYLEAAETDGFYSIEVRNQGDTIPEEALERLFEQFFRLDASRNSKNGGSGIGLAIARKIIEAHKGTITAESHDNWITFCISWPKSF